MNGKKLLRRTMLVTGGTAACLGQLLGCSLQLYAAFLHLMTVLMAYSLKGGIVAFLTLLLPPFSEVYWLIYAWSHGGAASFYAIAVYGIIGLGIVTVLLTGGGMVMAEKAGERLE